MTSSPRLSGAELISRGEYIVTSIGGCNDCHTPMTPNGPDMSKTLQGADLVFGPLDHAMPWAPHAPPIAGGPAGYSEEQFVRFLQSGGDTLVQVDSNGGANGFQTLAILKGVSAVSIHPDDVLAV